MAFDAEICTTTIRQRIYDIVKDGLIKQGGFSMRCGMCAYRGANGRKCAAGLFIDDADYEEGFEGKAICKLPRHVFGLAETEFQFLAELQKIHDDAALLSGLGGFIGWAAHMTALTKKYGLEA